MYDCMRYEASKFNPFLIVSLFSIQSEDVWMIYGWFMLQ